MANSLVIQTGWLIASALLLTACEQTPEPPAIPRPALVVTVGAHTAAAPTTLVGEVRSRYESAQGFRVGGKIVARAVEVGTPVKAGQLLARLDPIDASLASQAAQAEVRAAEADLALAKAELDRQRQLFEKKFIAKQGLDIHEARYKTAQAKLKQTQAQANVSGNQSKYAQLLAERDGVVTEIHAEPGQVVSVGEVVARIAVPLSKEVAIAVPESRMSGVQIDSPAEVRLWANPGRKYAGKVREVAPAADSATRTFQVRVSISDADNAVGLGMTAGVRFYHAQSDQYLLPAPALTQRDGHTVVWVVNPANGEVQPRAVQDGAYREDGVLIDSGLQAGEQVVVAGAQALVPGQVVRPIAPVHQP